MSRWAEIEGVIKIKEEFQEEFGFLYRGEYEKLTHPKMKEVAEDIIEVSKEFPSLSLNNTDKLCVDYEVSYVDGIYTFGRCYNYNYSPMRDFVWDFEDLIQEIGTWIERHGWIED